MNKLYLLLPIAAYANIFHHSIPSLSHPVAEKQTLYSIFGTTVTITLFSYCAVGGVLAWYFGSSIMVSSNLNWQSYVGIRNSHGNPSELARFLSFFVVLFPGADVASAFPLNAYTLGNNMVRFFIVCFPLKSYTFIDIIF